MTGTFHWTWCSNVSGGTIVGTVHGRAVTGTLAAAAALAARSLSPLFTFALGVNTFEIGAQAAAALNQNITVGWLALG